MKVIPVAPEPAEIQMLGKLASEPAEIVLLVDELSVVLMIEVERVRVNPVVVEVSQTVPVPERDHVPVLIVITLVFALAEENKPVEIFFVLASMVPLVRVKVAVAPSVKSSCN